MSGRNLLMELRVAARCPAPSGEPALQQAERDAGLAGELHGTVRELV